MNGTMDFNSQCLACHITPQRVLKLNNKSLTDSDLKMIAKALPNYPYLKGLDLSNNQISNQGALFLMQVLADDCPNIKELNLSFNRLNDDCVNGLCQNKTLHLNVISFNHVEPEAEIALARQNRENKINYQRQLSLFAQTGNVLLYEHHRKKSLLAKLSPDILMMVLHYLADIEESPLHISLLSVFLIKTCAKHSGKIRQDGFDLESVYAGTTEDEKKKAECMSKFFFPSSGEVLALPKAWQIAPKQ
ncbi:hypothetical protein [Legionella londiniensis]|uniref:Cytochrome c domain-containing protein n=1 Tax=Legionella londiniensis TaxID=45068 RepID=A0A0W0VHG9_9GAMM|nr:hypothetical protein [Legionella londiniensis]KTD19585.1 hypothetical protein Llon_2165 [Legionella londiniensis]STX92192.1 Ran GTPase-activating protein (RanGAP) involved in mRNA processing and transport [Legionella londiniensis]